jgi:hypothetical protein
VNETFDYLRTFAAFPFALRRFTARPRLTLEAAQRIVRERMARRDESFLRLVERGVYGHERSPYLPLLRQAGCELGDLRALVKAHGLEGALSQLRQAGVYVAFEEFKGRRPIRRGGLELPVRGSDFDNPLASRDLMMQTGGSTGAAHNVAADLDDLTDRAPQRLVALAAHGLVGAPTVVWQGILPAPGLRSMFFGAYAGNMPRRWFNPLGTTDSRSWVKYGLGSYYLILWMRLAGLPVPFPEHLRVDQALVVARWAAETLQTHGRCLVRGGMSRMVRVGLAAQAAGLDLTGATMSGGGEPPTDAKVRQVTCTGARYLAGYGMIDAGQLGAGCARPADVSDVHLFKDGFALITHPHEVEGFGGSVPAFNLTTLLPNTSKLLLNVEIDDYGVVEERSCGCDLESYGFTTHLRQIRSYSKLTGEGVTLMGSEMLRLLEEVLPDRFGGGPQDYQLMEDEDEQGLTRLVLIVHPRLSILDEQAVIACVLDGLGRSSAMADAARAVWQRAGTLQIKRVEPIWTGRGKLLPLHIARRADRRS